MKRALIVLVLLGAALFFWRLTSAPPEPSLPAAPLSAASAPVRTQPSPPPPPPPATSGQDAFSVWRSIAARHATHADADAQWRGQSVDRITSDLRAINDALAKNKQGVFAPRVEAVDCRAKSCVVELHFGSFPIAFRFVDLFEERRFELDYALPFSFECPLVRYALPREPGKDQADFPVLMHFECN